VATETKTRLGLDDDVGLDDDNREEVMSGEPKGKELLLRAGQELSCPHCGGGVTLTSVTMNMPTDQLVIRFEGEPLTAVEIDGGDDRGGVTLGLSCPRCEPRLGGGEYLIFRDGDTRAGTFIGPRLF
jgi:hypothetical protein